MSDKPLENLTEEQQEAILDAYLDKIKNEYKDAWTEQNWESEMEKHPFFMTRQVEEGKELPPLVEALQQLKWDETDTARDKALGFKEEGNILFKAKKYKNAVVSYTNGIKQEKLEQEDKELASTLYSNRASAHFYLQNYRSALGDSASARKLNAKNVKVIYRGAECCYKLRLFDDVKKWCDMAFALDPKDAKALELLSKSEELRKTVEKEKRKKENENRKKTQRLNKIQNLIKLNNIQIQEKEEFESILENPINPYQAPVCLSDEEEAHIVWPVVVLYPEHGQTDFIQQFHENSTFEEHLKVVLETPPSWDTDHNYRLNNINLYYENRKTGTLCKLNKNATLLSALKKEGFVVQMGTPSCMVMVAGSPFEKMYIQKYAEL
jgi:tetratricopeptide (TPR) repeat protein